MCPVCGAGLRGDSAFCPTCGASLVGTTGRLQADRLLAGRYRIVRLLARGGMGAVYLAEDTRLGGAQVAVKEMASTFARGDTEAFARAVGEFEREAAMLARLRHAHLPRVSDRFEEGGKHYLVMEYIHGQTLRAVIQQAGGQLPLAQALDYADQLCDVLTYLHNQQPPIIYRDLKPANVMVVSDDGPSTIDDSGQHGRSAQLVLIDFGIARFYRPGRDSDTAVYGTLGYAPPEQYGKGQTDARTDVYALGVLLHHALTGYDPSSSPFALPPPRALNPAIPPEVAAAIERATANDREARFPDIAAFRAALRATARPTDQQVVRRGETSYREVAAANAAARATTVGHAARGPRVWLFGIAGALLVAAVVLFVLLRSWDIGARLEIAAAPTHAPASVATADVAAEATEELLSPPEANSQPTDEAAVATQTGDAEPELRVLTPSGVSASRTAAAGIDSQNNPVTYEPENAIDGQNDTTWRVDGDGVGDWLELDFDAEVSVSKVGIIPGYDKIDAADGTDRFAQNRVVKKARLEFSDGSSVSAEFAQQRDMQFVELPKPIRTHSIRIVIEETYPPPPAPDGRDFTPISEVQVQGSLER